MIGAIIGDIVGEPYEFDNIKTKDFPLFNNSPIFTDDSIMTIAIGKALLECNYEYSNLSEKVIKYMQEIGRPYPNSGYGGNFYHWIYSDNPQPYNSYGNGAGMRVSACGIVGKSLEEVKYLSKIVTQVSHNHPEGIKGAEAVAISVFLAKDGKTKSQINKFIRDNYYNIDFTLDEIRPTYKFNEISQDTIPQALQAFFESNSFEDAIRNAISIGGDSDTLAAITGSIAAVYYGVPKDIYLKAKTILDQRLLTILEDFELKYSTKII